MTWLISSFQAFVDLVGPRLWQATLTGGAGLALVWAITRFVKPISPRITCWLWRLACLKLLVALLWVQPVFLRLLPPVQSEFAAPSSQASASLPGSASPGASSADVMPPEHPPLAPSVDWSWSDSLVAVWLLGVAIAVAVTIRQWRQARRIIHSSHPVDDPSRLATIRNIAVELGIESVPELRTSSGTHSPLLVGLWRPVVILPADVDVAFDARELRLMLAHELGHLKRRDLAWNWLLTIVSWLFYFHPLVWIAHRGWSESQEAACDELLIQQQVTGPAEYGRLLLKVATSWPQSSNGTLLAAGVLGAYRVIEKRILTMSSVKPVSHFRIRAIARMLTGIAVLGLVPWKLAAREATAIAQTEAKDQAKPSSLPGRIYLPAFFETDSGEVRALIEIDPNTGEWEKFGPYSIGHRISPNGKLMVVQAMVDAQQKLVLLNMSDQSTKDLPLPATDISKLTGDRKEVTETVGRPVWSPDGKFVLYNATTTGVGTDGRGRKNVAFLLDPTTNGKQALGLPDTDEVDDWSPKGNWLVTVSNRHPPFGRGYQLYVMHPDGTDERRVTEDRGLNCYPRFSPDGTKIAYTHQERGKNSLMMIDTNGENRRVVVEGKGEQGEPGHACWSPDGEVLAVVKQNIKDKTYIQGSERIELLSKAGESRGELNLKGIKRMIWLGEPEWR